MPVPTIVASNWTEIAAGSGVTTAPIPAGGQSGDIIYLVRFCDRQLTGLETSGYTDVFPLADGNNGSVRLFHEWKTWASETSVDIAQLGAGAQACVIYLIRGADTTNPIHLVGTFALPSAGDGSTGSPAVAPGITTTIPDTLVLGSVMVDDDLYGVHPLTLTSGWSNIVWDEHGLAANGGTHLAATLDMPTAGATGDLQADWGARPGDDIGGVQVAIAPAAASGGASADPGAGSATGAGHAITVTAGAAVTLGAGAASGAGHAITVATPAPVPVYTSTVVEIDAPTATGNLFDVTGSLTFTHATAANITVPFYFTGTGTTFAFKFTPTAPGAWAYTSTSSQTELNGLSGSIDASANAAAYGFLTNTGNKLAHTRGDGSVEAIDWPLIMAPTYLGRYVDNASAVTAGFTDLADAIQTDFVDRVQDHGMRGVHIHAVGGRWFDANSTTGNEGTSVVPATSGEDPDPDTFLALENIASTLNALGFVTMLWMWGDGSRNQTSDQLTGSTNGAEHNRLLRYVAARLCAQPGIILGNGFDNFEWTSPAEQATSLSTLTGLTSYPVLYAPRSTKIIPDEAIDSGDTAWTDGFPYADFEQHVDDTTSGLTMLPDAMAQYSDRPIISGDRFRVRDANGSGGENSKDFTESQTVENLHISTMVGGLGGIYGNLWDGASSLEPYDGSRDYAAQTRTEMATYRTFWDAYFNAAATPRNAITGADLGLDCGDHMVALALNTNSAAVNLSTLSGDGDWSSVRVSYVDIRAPYALNLDGSYGLTNETISFGSTSDWLVLIEKDDGATVDVDSGAATGAGHAVAPAAGSTAALLTGAASGAGHALTATAGASALLDTGAASGAGHAITVETPLLFGTGPNPTDFAAGVGQNLEVTVTIGGFQYTVSAPIGGGVAAPTLSGATLPQQDLLRGVALTSAIDFSVLFSGSVTSYSIDGAGDPLPGGLNLNTSTGQVPIGDTPTEGTLPTQLPIVQITATGPGGSVTHTQGVVFSVTGPELSALSATGNTVSLTTGTGDGTMHLWFGTDPNPSDADLINGAGTGFLAERDFTVTGSGGSTTNWDLSAHDGVDGYLFALQVAADGSYSNRAFIEFTPQVVAAAAAFEGWGTLVKTADNTPTTSLDCAAGAPAGVVSGDMLVAFCAADGASTHTPSTGWTQLLTDAQSTQVRGSVFYRVADGGANDSFTLGISATQEAAVIIGRASGVSNISGSIGNNLAFDPPSHTPASNGQVWMTGAASDSFDNVTAAPSGWINFLSDGGGVGGSATISGATLVADAASQDPGAFSGGGGEQNVCWTVALW